MPAPRPKRLSPDERGFRRRAEVQTGITWHRLIHGYADVSLDLVWATVREELPALIAVLEGVIPAADDPERST